MGRKCDTCGSVARDETYAVWPCPVCGVDECNEPVDKRGTCYVVHIETTHPELYGGAPLGRAVVA